MITPDNSSKKAAQIVDGEHKRAHTKSFENKNKTPFNEMHPDDLLENYLQEAQNKHQPFDVVSDEDLLASNFDVSSKAL